MLFGGCCKMVGYRGRVDPLCGLYNSSNSQPPRAAGCKLWRSRRWGVCSMPLLTATFTAQDIFLKGNGEHHVSFLLARLTIPVQGKGPKSYHLQCHRTPPQAAKPGGGCRRMCRYCQRCSFWSLWFLTSELPTAWGQCHSAGSGYT